MDLNNIALDQPSRSTSPQKRTQQRHGAWSLTEDARLRGAYAKYGNRWVTVAAEVGTRSSDQCAKRWCENLNPELDHGPWTPEEEEYLLQLVQIHGHNWRFMADHYLESRAPLALKNRYMLLMRRAKRQENAQQYVANAATAAAAAAAAASITTASTTITPTTTTSTAHADQPRQTRRATTIPLPRSRNGSPFFDNSDLSDYMSASGDQLQSRHWSPTPIMADAPAQLQNITAETTQSIFNQATWPKATSSAGSRRTALSQANAPVTPPISATWDEPSMMWQQSPWNSDFDLSKHLNDASNGTIIQQRTTCAPMMTPTSSVAGFSQRNDDPGVTMCARSRNNEGMPPAVEYSITCPASKLKNTVNRLVDAIMLNIEGCTADDDQVVVVLKLKAR